MCVKLNRWCVNFCFAEGQYGEGCVFVSTLWKYDLRKGDLFVMRWAKVRRVYTVYLDCFFCGVYK